MGYKNFHVLWKICIIYNSIVYKGSRTPVDETEQEMFGFTAAIVLHLCRIPVEVGHKLYFHNFFTSIPLLYKLLQKRIFAAGTIRQNKACRMQIRS